MAQAVDDVMIVPIGTTNANFGRPGDAPVLTLSGPSASTVGVSATFTLAWANIVSAGAASLAWPGTEVFSPATVAVSVGSGSSQFTLTPSSVSSGNVVATLGAVSSNAVAFASVAAAPPPAPVPPGSFRTSRALLFQAVDSASRAEQIVGAGAYVPDTANFGQAGPTRSYVSRIGGWKWVNSGGDWIDSGLVAQGTTPWATATAAQNATVGATTPITLACTSALQNVQTNGRWAAFKLGALAPRSVCSPFHVDTSKRPRIEVTYTDATSETLPCNVLAADNTSATPSTSAQLIALPAFIEFKKPAKAVSSATMHLTVGELQWSGTPTIQLVGILTPNTAMQPVTGTGALATTMGPLDAGITADPTVIIAHRYVDGTALTDFVTQDYTKSHSESHYDPKYWGGTEDLNKLPHTAQTTTTANIKGPKWLKLAQGGHPETGNPTLLTSAQIQALGIQPLAPGLGALSINMPVNTVNPGDEVGNTGTLGVDLRAPLPHPHFGEITEFWTRWYEVIVPRRPITPADRPQVLSSGTPRWTDLSGKTGISVACVRGNSGGSGGDNGWQTRASRYVPDYGVDGPDVDGEIKGEHWFDFQQNPVGHNYNTNPADERHGAIGGWGAVQYEGQHVMYETHIRLNDWDPVAGTFVANGIYEVFRDGRLVLQKTDFVFRAPPLITRTYSPNGFRPFGGRGPHYAMIDEFHGGQSDNTIPHHKLYTGYVMSTQRVGAMNLNVAPSWQLPYSSAGALGYATGTHPQGLDGTLDEARPSNQPWAVSGAGDGTHMAPSTWLQMGAFCAPVWVPSMRKVSWAFNAGHVAPNTVVPISYNLATLAWEWEGQPLHTADGWTLVNNMSGQATPANLLSAYGDRMNHTFWDFDGGHSSIPVAQRQVGKVFPQGTHTRTSGVWIPGSAYGNTNGALIQFSEPTGNNGNNVGVFGGGHCWDFDQARFVRNAATRVRTGGGAGGAVWSDGLARVIGTGLNSSAFAAVIEVFNPAPGQRNWVDINCSSGLPVTPDGVTLLRHPAGVIFAAVSSMSNGNASYAGTEYRLYGILESTIQNALDNPGTQVAWVAMGLTASSYPQHTFDGNANSTAGLGFSTYVPNRNSWYAINGQAGSTTLWRLRPPAGATTAAQILAGTWTLTTETLTAGIPCSAAGGGTNQQFVYNGLAYDEVSDELIGMTSDVTMRPFHIRPAA